MTATYAYDDQPRAGHPLLPGASPHDIRAHLLPEDRDKLTGEAIPDDEPLAVTRAKAGM